MAKTVLTGIATRFWSKVSKTASCWLWVGGTNSCGYGSLGKGRRGDGRVSAHRLSWELHNGPIPKGKNVLHRCDNPACVNPSHLFLGSQQDNVDDMVEKGRRGKTGPTPGTGAKLGLGPERLAELRTDAGSLTQTQLATKYGIGQSTVSRILRNKSAYNIG